MWVIQIVDERAPDMTGLFVREYDPSRFGHSPAGNELLCHLELVENPDAAMHFETLHAAIDYVRTAYGFTPDGDPRRPLTALNTQICSIAAALSNAEARVTIAFASE